MEDEGLRERGRYLERLGLGAREEVPPCCATFLGACACRQVLLPRGLWQGYSSLWLDSEDATYMVTLATVC